jgi:hypothetical protein
VHGMYIGLQTTLRVSLFNRHGLLSYVLSLLPQHCYLPSWPAKDVVSMELCHLQAIESIWGDFQPSPCGGANWTMAVFRAFD